MRGLFKKNGLENIMRKTSAIQKYFPVADAERAYILISDFYYRLEFPNRAEKILDRALELANTIKDTKKRTFMIDQINKAQ